MMSTYLLGHPVLLEVGSLSSHLGWLGVKRRPTMWSQELSRTLENSRGGARTWRNIFWRERRRAEGKQQPIAKYVMLVTSTNNVDQLISTSIQYNMFENCFNTKILKDYFLAILSIGFFFSESTKIFRIKMRK